MCWMSVANNKTNQMSRLITLVDSGISRQQVFTYFEQHVFLTGCEVHLVLVVVDTQVDNVSQQLLVAVYHF